MPRLFFLVLVVFAFIGCGDKHDHHDDHDHAGHSHDHGHKAGAKAHSHEAPHGGALVELGEHFAHVEFWRNESGKVFSAFILDGHAANPVRIAQTELVIELSTPQKSDSPTASARTIVLKAVASTVTGETVGDTSQFDASLDALGNAANFDATIKSITVKGKTLTDVKFNYPRGNE